MARSSVNWSKRSWRDASGSSQADARAKPTHPRWSAPQDGASGADVMPQVSGRADGSVVSQLVKESWREASGSSQADARAKPTHPRWSAPQDGASGADVMPQVSGRAD